jgi:protein-tyrosine-phosphatase
MFVRAIPAWMTGTITVSSAGFIGPDRSPPPNALVTASRFGADLSEHRSSLITTHALASADLIVVMSESQARDIRAALYQPKEILILGDLDPSAVSSRTILDPWGGPDTAFDASYERIHRCVRELARIIAGVD